MSAANDLAIVAFGYAAKLATHTDRFVANALRCASSSLRRKRSSPHALDQREVGFGGDDAPKPEP